MPKYLLMRLFIAIGLLFINTVNAQFGHLPPAVSKYQLDLLKKETDAGNHTAAISWCTLQLGYVVYSGTSKEGKALIQSMLAPIKNDGKDDIYDADAMLVEDVYDSIGHLINKKNENLKDPIIIARAKTLQQRYQKLSNAGIGDASEELSKAYLQGNLGLAVDKVLGKHYHQLALKQGSYKAAFHEGKYKIQQKHQYAEGIKWLEKAINPKDSFITGIAKGLIADLLLQGKDVEKNPEKAARLYYEAAQFGNNKAPYHLANLYYDEREKWLPRNKQNSYIWILIAMEMEGEFEHNLSKQKELQAIMTPEEMRNAIEIANRWKKDYIWPELTF